MTFFEIDGQAHQIPEAVANYLHLLRTEIERLRFELDTANNQHRWMSQRLAEYSNEVDRLRTEALRLRQQHDEQLDQVIARIRPLCSPHDSWDQASIERVISELELMKKESAAIKLVEGK